jgi:hypothetical protein
MTGLERQILFHLLRSSGCQHVGALRCFARRFLEHCWCLIYVHCNHYQRLASQPFHSDTSCHTDLPGACMLLLSRCLVNLA